MTLMAKLILLSAQMHLKKSKPGMKQINLKNLLIL